ANPVVSLGNGLIQFGSGTSVVDQSITRISPTDMSFRSNGSANEQLRISSNELALSNAGQSVVISSTNTARIMFGTGNGNSWEIDNSSGTMRFLQPGTR